VSRFVDDDFADAVGVCAWDEGFGVCAGDLQAVEEWAGALGVDAVLGEGGEEHGERDLDGLAVFEGWEFQMEGLGLEVVVVGDQGVLAEEVGVVVLAVDDDAAVGFGLQVAVMSVGLLVWVAEGLVFEGEGAAAEAVGADVAAELCRHKAP